MPGTLAARFTVGETAVLAVIAQEVARHGACHLFIEQLAALAGVTRSTVKRALKEAHGLGFIRIEERRLTAWRNDANVVTIIDPAWSAWLRLRRRGEGSRKGSARNTDSNNKANPRSTSNVARGFRGEEAAQAPGSTQNQSPAQAVPWPDTASSRGVQGQPSMAGIHVAKGELPSLQRRGVHGYARMRGT
jgi:DNA-binding transcriptional MocR family regulator